MHSAPGLVCSNRPEGRLLSCFDSSATQTIPTVCIRGSGMAVQGPPLLALPVSLCFYEDRRGCPYPATGSGWMDPLPLDGPCLSTAGVPLEQVSRHTVVATDASSMDWGATCNRQAALGLWTGPRLIWYINCLELWAVHLALRQFQPLSDKFVLICTDNTAAVSYINCLGGIRSRRMSQLAMPSQITACCPHPGEAQSHGRCALTIAHVPRRMVTPSRDDPADLESIQGIPVG